MTTRKYNAIKRYSAVASYPQTFEDVLAAVVASIDVTKFTARQVAAMVDFGYSQHTRGYEKAANELL